MDVSRNEAKPLAFDAERVRVKDVCVEFVRHPARALGRRWNWKAAALSSVMRALIFFAATIGAGTEVALWATFVEFCFRAIVSGVFGTLIESFSRAEPAWARALVIAVILPTVAQILELVVHYINGTPNLARGVIISSAFTVLSSVFNLYAMRRGALTVCSAGRRSFLQDLK